jgi:hypothetical protein
MKKGSSLIVLATLLLLSVLLYRSDVPATKAGTDSETAEIKEKLAWDLERLRDPETGIIPRDMRMKEIEFSSHIPSNSTSRNTPLYFENRGPFNVGGRTRAFAFDKLNPDHLIAGSVSGGIYSSNNGGTTWTETTTPEFGFGITCIAQDQRPGKTNVWYCGTGEAYGTSASGNGAFFLGNGILKSTDNGLSWNFISSTTSNTAAGFDNAFDLVWNIKTDPARMDSDIVYASCYGAIWRSNNGGNNWKRVIGTFGTNSDVYFTDVNLSASGVVYATASSENISWRGIWRSENGLQFTNITPQGFPTAFDRIVTGIAPSNENIVYAIAHTYNFGASDTGYTGDIEWNTLWKYIHSDTGGTWVDLSANMPWEGGVFDKYRAQGSYNMVIAVKPDDPDVVILGGTNIHRSTDGFSTPDNIKKIGGYEVGTNLPVVKSYPNNHPDQHVFFFHPDNPDVMFNGNDGGMYRTDNILADSVEWTSLNNGYLTTQFYTIAIDQATANDPVIIGGTQDNGSWFTNNTSPTAPWLYSRGGDGSFCAIADNKTVFYYSIQNGKIQKAYVDANGNSGSFARIDPIGASGYKFINPFILDPLDSNIMYLPAGYRLYRNNDLSGVPMINNWDSIATNWVYLPDTCNSSTGAISAVACSKNPAHVLYYGTDKKRIYRVADANTGNPTRTDITPANFPNAYISCIAVDPTDANKVAVIFSNYKVNSIWYSENGGQNWQRCGGNLEETPTGAGNGPSVRWMTILHRNDGNVYLIATSTGVYATNKLQADSTFWIKQGISSIGNRVCEMIISRDVDGLVVVASHGNGIFTTTINSVEDIFTAIPDKQLIQQDVLYPNPGSDYPTLLCTVAKPTPLTIKVYAIDGSLISSQQQQVNHSGQHRIALSELQSRPAGLYLIELNCGIHRRSYKWIKL